MNTTSFEMNDNLTFAESYYHAMLAKDVDKMASYLSFIFKHDFVDCRSSIVSLKCDMK